ncbi:ATP-binding protein [Sagittula sp. SSi028]|uniref:hybrid sensor histidine kinase/response regulator n=1 Tax=Sagittula sp. SSi028 TaxID=3400636 RepID=UPI003AF8FE57
MAAVALIAAILLVGDVVREFRRLNHASSDNTHWVLSQAEVEFLEFSNAIIAGQNGAPLSDVVMEFDIFYSRMTTLGTGSLYADLRRIPAYGEPIEQIRQQLDDMIPTIDGPREELAAALPDLQAQAALMRLELRDAATTSLAYFSQQSDASRENVAATLLKLAGLTIAMLLALLAAVARSRMDGRQIERRGAELADAYARLNTILDTSLDGVIVSDTEGRILTFNTAAERMFQYRYEEVYKRLISDVMIPEHLRAAHDDGMRRMSETTDHKIIGKGRVRLEAKRRNGDIFPIEVALQTARAGGEDVIIGFMRDISHRVKAENELLDARDRALAGEKAKAEFLAMMTHEIRTPLNGLLGNLALLKQTELTDAQKLNVRDMDISGDLLMHHVDSVLDVARFESGQTSTQQDVVNIGALLQEIVDGQSTAAQNHGNWLSWTWAGPALEWVSLDESRLKQVLLNLVGNAIKFTRDGEITIEIEHWDEAGQTVLDIRVADTGVGIPEDQQARVFEDFHTISHGGTIQQSVGGTGLGLGIARRFVEALGGQMGLESELGMGSTFWISLPVELAEPPAAEVTAAEEPPKDMPPQNILLVEDNQINRDLARNMLQHLGHHVTEACNGQEAVDLAETQQFDLILMDIRMPVMDGLTATHKIRGGNGPNKAVPIVAVSANVLPEARDRFLAAGMSSLLPKPMDPKGLARVIGRFGREDKNAAAAPSGQPVAVTPAPSGPPASDVPPQVQALMDRYTAEVSAFFDGLAKQPDRFDEIAEEAHRLAGSAAAFGQKRLRATLIEVELLAEDRDLNGVVEAMDKARTAWVEAPAPKID